MFQTPYCAQERKVGFLRRGHRHIVLYHYHKLLRASQDPERQTSIVVEVYLNDLRSIGIKVQYPIVENGPQRTSRLGRQNIRTNK